MSKNPYVSKVGENRNGSDLKAEEVPISKFETEPPFKDRLREVIGDRKLVWFAKECGFSDSLLGSYLRGEKLPGFDNLVSIARVGGVTVDWLATGRSPKTRAELKAIAVAPAVPAPAPSDGRLETYRIAVEAVQAWQLEHDRYLQPDKLVQALDLLVELAEGDTDQLKPLAERVLRIAA